MPNQIVDFNLPNAYQAEMDKIAYQQRLAEMLQKQSEEPIGEYSYKGIQARIPATAGLAKVLQAFGAAYNQKKAEEQKTALQNQQLEDYRNDYAMAREARMGVAGTDAVPSSGMIPAVAGSPEVRVGDETVMGMAPSSAAQQYKPAVQATPEREPYGMAPSTFAKDAVAAVAPNPQEYERILQESKNPLLNERGLFAQESRLEREQAANIKEGDRQTQIKRIIASYGPNPPSLANGMTLLQSLQIDPSGKLYADQRKADLERLQEQTLADRAFNNLSATEKAKNKLEADRINISQKEYNLEKWKAENLSKDTKPLTDFQSKSVGYGMRMVEAENILQKLANTGTFRPAIISGAPVVGKVAAQNLPSWLGGNSDEQQRVKQAKTNFITAVLRGESGATILPSEFETEDKKYFPQVNDGPETIKQKADARRLAIKVMKIQSGPGAKNIPDLDPVEETNESPSTMESRNLNSNVSKIPDYVSPYKKTQERTTDAAIPQDVDPKLWAVMTTEERKAWQQ